MPYLSVGDCRIFYQVDGSADRPVLMFSNSIGSDLSMWEGQVQALSGRFRVLRYDSRGHGRSDVPPGPYTIDRLGLDAAMLIDGLGLRQVNFCGLSKGGMVGMWLGANAAHVVGRLILANTSSDLGPPEFWDERIRVVQTEGMAGLVDRVIDRWFTPEFIQRAPAEIERCRRMLLSTPVEGYAACCAAIRDMYLTTAIKGIRTPTLVIVGDRDPATPPAHGEEIATAIPGATLVRLPASHLSNIEAANDFNAAVTTYLTAEPKHG